MRFRILLIVTVFLTVCMLGFTSIFRMQLVDCLASDPQGWTRTYGGANSDGAVALVQTLDGGYALVGSTQSFGAGNWDFWLVKVDASGNMMWNQTYGGTNIDIAYSVVQTLDGGYATAGSTNSFGAGNEDFWLIKMDANGNMEWNQTYGGTNRDSAYSVVQTLDEGYTIAGVTQSFGAGNWDFWLVKTDASGNMMWNQTYGEAGFDWAYSVVQTLDGGYALVGSTDSFGPGNWDFWLVKVDASGNMMWNQTYGGTFGDECYALVQTLDGGYALVGHTDSFGAGGRDFWLVKVDASGNMMWNQTYGGTNDDWAFSVVEAVYGGYTLAGATESFGAGSQDFWLVKVDASGNMMWNQTYGEAGFDWAYSVVQTLDGGYALVGSTDSFGAGNWDFWLVKTDFSGVIPEFPLPLILPFFMALTLVVIIYRRKDSSKSLE